MGLRNPGVLGLVFLGPGGLGVQGSREWGVPGFDNDLSNPPDYRFAHKILDLIVKTKVRCD